MKCERVVGATNLRVWEDVPVEGGEEAEAVSGEHGGTDAGGRQQG